MRHSLVERQRRQNARAIGRRLFVAVVFVLGRTLGRLGRIKKFPIRARRTPTVVRVRFVKCVRPRFVVDDDRPLVYFALAPVAGAAHTDVKSSRALSC